MYKANKSLTIFSLVFAFAVFFLAGSISTTAAEESYVNISPDPNMMMAMSEPESVGLPFDPNDYTFLVYNPGGNEASIVQAMKKILGRDLDPNEIRTAESGKHVTAEDLTTHDILIVGWNSGGYMSGLSKDVIGSGITGRVILTGHDADFHTAGNRWEQPYAEKFLTQAINYVLEGSGTGLVAKIFSGFLLT